MRKAKKHITYYTVDQASINEQKENPVTPKQKKIIKRVKIVAYIIAWVFCWWTAIAILLNDTLQDIITRPFDAVRRTSSVIIFKLFHPKLLRKNVYKRVYMNEDWDVFEDNIFASYDENVVAKAVFDYLKTKGKPTDMKTVKKRAIMVFSRPYAATDCEIAKEFEEYNFKWVEQTRGSLNKDNKSTI